MSKNTNNKRANSMQFYVIALLLIFVIPLLLIFSYEWLGGGILNGLGGSWRTPVINPDILLLGYAIIEAVLYIGLCFAYKNYLNLHKTETGKLIAATTLLVLATAVSLTVIFWKMFTT